jgi:hypothetical protein
MSARALQTFAGRTAVALFLGVTACGGESLRAAQPAPTPAPPKAAPPAQAAPPATPSQPALPHAAKPATPAVPPGAGGLSGSFGGLPPGSFPGQGGTPGLGKPGPFPATFGGFSFAGGSGISGPAVGGFSGPFPAGFPGQPGGVPGGNFGSAISGIGGTLPSRVHFVIDPKTPVKDLLPPAPPAVSRPGPVLSGDLARVPEVRFQAPPAGDLNAVQSLEQMAHLMAKLRYLNGKKSDGAMEALLEHRPDLRGLPVAMGDRCRTPLERSKQFTVAVGLVRSALQAKQGNTARHVPLPIFWERFQLLCQRQDSKGAGATGPEAEHVRAARVAALMQMLAPEPAPLRVGLAKYLATVPHVEATRALARLAVFSPEEEVRRAALDGLALRRERDYADILLHGLRHPWPDAARHAGEALVKLERADLVPQLVALLDEPDPRAPVVREVNGKKVPVVRELVRVNHLKNCLLCHSPADPGVGLTPNGGVAMTAVIPKSGLVTPGTVLTAPVPLPNQKPPPSFGGYGQSQFPDILVRIDVVYLRQDFSAMQAVPDPGPGPKLQRFDFLVRARELSDREAATWRTALAKHTRGDLTPYQQAVLAALRRLTGKEAEATAEAWRRVLALPAPPPAPVLSARGPGSGEGAAGKPEQVPNQLLDVGIQLIGSLFQDCGLLGGGGAGQAGGRGGPLPAEAVQPRAALTEGQRKRT